MRPLSLSGNTRLARAMVCMRVWLRIGLSKYRVEHDGASNPVSHIAHTNTSLNGSAGSLNLESRSSLFIRCRCGTISNPSCARSSCSFWACDTTTAISVERKYSIAFQDALVPATEQFQVQFPWCGVCDPSALSQDRAFTAVALSIATYIPLPRKPRLRKWSTMSSAMISKRSCRVTRWYWREN